MELHVATSPRLERNCWGARVQQFFFSRGLSVTKQPTNNLFSAIKTKYCKQHCRQQRKATREAIRLNELIAYVKK